MRNTVGAGGYGFYQHQEKSKELGNNQFNNKFPTKNGNGVTS